MRLGEGVEYLSWPLAANETTVNSFSLVSLWLNVLKGSHLLH